MIIRLATGNPHKLVEAAAILGPEHVIEPVAVDAAETGQTYEANALIKARAGFEVVGQACWAEDSGIEIDALDGRPGIHSAGWTAESDWIPRVLRELEERPDRPRTARYIAVAAMVDGRGGELTVRGVVEGTIAPGPVGEGGFGYDPIFVPAEGDGRTFGEMDPAEKHLISHRVRALRGLAAQLEDS